MTDGRRAVINALFILNDAPAEPGRSLNALCLASSMSLHASSYVRVFLLGPAAACACSVHGLREREASTALLATVIRHGGEVRICQRSGDEQPGCTGHLIAGASPASLADLSRWIAEADSVLVF